jgi:hypothetical protein
VLEFQRDRVKQQQSGAASADILKTAVELRSALQCIEKAIQAVERLAIAQLGEDAWGPRESVPPQNKKKLRPNASANVSSVKRKGRVVALPHSPCARENHPAVPESAGAQT